MNNTLNFYKYHGTGNDFIIINSFDTDIKLVKDSIKQMCSRQFGIGADGLMILRKRKGYDFEMDFYNSDGNPGSMCGNGGRCIVAFAHDMGIIKDKTRFLAPDGEHEAIFHSHDKISLKMIDVNKIENHELGVFMDTGSPHLVLIKDSTKNLDVYKEGHNIRYSSKYSADGINVNFVVEENKKLKIFTYERGVENQTFSCGTGTVASAITMNYKNNLPSPIKFKSLGGDLLVYFEHVRDNVYKNIWLEGPAIKTFSGDYCLS